jgi:hypothetical protein
VRIVRYWHYETTHDFIRDGLRLSEGMGRKNALAGVCACVCMCVYACADVCVCVCVNAYAYTQMQNACAHKQRRELCALLLLATL